MSADGLTDSDALDEAAEAVQWWYVPLPLRVVTVLTLWLFLVVGVVFFAGSVYMLAVPEEREWNEVIGGIVYLPFVWIMARSFILGIGVAEEALLIRRPPLCREERIPFDRIRRCAVAGIWFHRSLYVSLRSPLPLVLNYSFGLWPPTWDQLVSALREKLEPIGKWRE